jgi:hypothetical protein
MVPRILPRIHRHVAFRPPRCVLVGLLLLGRSGRVAYLAYRSGGDQLRRDE